MGQQFSESPITLIIVSPDQAELYEHLKGQLASSPDVQVFFDRRRTGRRRRAEPSEVERRQGERRQPPRLEYLRLPWVLVYHPQPGIVRRGFFERSPRLEGRESLERTANAPEEPRPDINRWVEETREVLDLLARVFEENARFLVQADTAERKREMLFHDMRELAEENRRLAHERQEWEETWTSINRAVELMNARLGELRRIETPSPTIEGKTILVVDDEPELVAILADMLSAEGCHVDTAANGLIALERLEGREYDLIVSDIKMPGLDGPSLYRETARQHPHLVRRFIFTTGGVTNFETTEFLQETRSPILIKPFTFEDVRRVVRLALEAA